MRIEGSRVLVTGASSGLGAALAAEFAKKGAVVVLAARRLERLRQVAARITSEFPEAPTPLVVKCDVRVKKDVANLVKSCVDRLGGVDIMVNNAGTAVYGETARVSVEDFQDAFEVNFFGALRCMYEVLPVMKKQAKGLIVTISSVAGLHGIPYLATYSSSKAAIMAVSQSLRAEQATQKTGVWVMIVCPGYIQTEMFAKEKNVGGGHRPRHPYRPAPKVAKGIVRAIERGKRDLVMTLEGKTLAAFKGLLPGLNEMTMRKIARKLHD